MKLFAKTVIVFFLSIFFFYGQTEAQSQQANFSGRNDSLGEFKIPSFNKKGFNISVGYGGISYIRLLSSHNSDNPMGFAFNPEGTPSELGPFYFKIEKGIDDNFSVGLDISFLKDKWAYNASGGTYPSSSSGTLPIVNFSETDTRYAFNILIRLSYHFITHGRFDPYIGFAAGARPDNTIIWKSEQAYRIVGKGNDDTHIGLDASAGCRYLISRNLSIYVEAGICASPFQAGLTFNLKSD